MSTRPAQRTRRRDYRDFTPRWICGEPGCAATGGAPPTTEPADVADALSAGLDHHNKSAHREHA